MIPFEQAELHSLYRASCKVNFLLTSFLEIEGVVVSLTANIKFLNCQFSLLLQQLDLFRLIITNSN